MPNVDIASVPIHGHVTPLLAISAGLVRRGYGVRPAQADYDDRSGGKPILDLGPLPQNARAAEFLPYDRLLPLTTVMVTNGGYGGVHFALTQGELASVLEGLRAARASASAADRC